ncbi:MAG: hypothetical protein IIB14_02430, partial [Chloroflexi bacterium]|nr:hypothetical protein [Chloroflexota bacterium]
MADFAQISVSEDQLKIDPGSDASTTISIRNSGSVVDVFTVEIAGLDESWVDLSVSSVSLFPGDQSTSELKITVPRDGTALARKYPFTVKVASRKDPSQTVDVECALEVGAYYEFNANIDPLQARGGSHGYSVLLSNTGNAELSVTLEGSDPQGNSSFTYSQRTARIAPGNTQTVTVTVVAINRPLRGRPRTTGFSIQASPAQGTATPVTLTGRLEVPPRLPRWAIPAGIGAFMGIAALIAIVVVLTRGGDEPTPPVQVAAPSQGQPTANPIPPAPSGPITLTVAQPLAGNFELAPDQERDFEIVVKEPGFVLIQLGWDVTGNGLLVKLEVAEDDPALLKELENAGAPLVLLDEELTEPTGEYRVAVGDAYIDLKLRVVLRNDTPDPTNGSVSVFFQRMPPATATATKTNTPTPTTTATPTLTATATPSPTATNTPKPTNTPRVIKITPIIRLSPILKFTPIIDGGPVILPALIPPNTPAPTSTNTPAPTPTNTPTPTATNTPLAISPTPTNL